MSEGRDIIEPAQWPQRNDKRVPVLDMNFDPPPCGSLCRLASLLLLRQKVLQPRRCRRSHVLTLQRRHAARKLVTLDNHKHHSGRGIANRSSIIQRAQPQGISSLLDATLRPVLVAGLF